MQKLLIWLSILLVIGFGGKYAIDYMSHSAHENTATLRVQEFLDGMKPGGDFEAAFNMWYMGSPNAMGNITQDQYNMYVQELRAWLAQRKIGPGVQAYEIHGATMISPPEGLEPSVVEVSCTIDGKAVVIRAADGRRLGWAN